MKEIMNIANKLHEMHVNHGQLAWTKFTTGYDFGIEESHKKMMDFMKDKSSYETILNYKKQSLNSLDKRRVNLMYKAFKPYHLSDEVNNLALKIQKKVNELSQILNTFRFKLDGQNVTSVDLAQILSNEVDQEIRKKAYLAKNQINQPMIDAGFLDLIEMRKEMAKLNGFDNFVAYKLDQEELSEEIFDTWTSEIHALLPEIKKVRCEFANKYLQAEEIMPWDEAFIENKLAPSLSKNVDMTQYYSHLSRVFQTFGFNLNEYNITYDLFPRANKSEWGYNFPIDTQKDSRILANVKNQFSEYGVLLHETGHGVHSFLNDAKEKILNMGISGIITEGIANLFGGMLYDPLFYKSFFEEDFKDVEEQFTQLKKWKKVNALRAIARIFFDQKFYTSKNETLEDVYKMYWEVQADVLKQSPGDYEPPWAFLIHHTTHPIYLHNYFMGDVTCEMLKDVFNEKYRTESISEKPLDFGKFLFEEVVKPSGIYTYSELFERISKSKFNLSYMKE
jgi:oligoendopeptidase F